MTITPAVPTVITAKLNRHVLGMTLAIGLAELTLAGLAFIDRLNPTTPSTSAVVDVLIVDDFWAGAFLIVGIWMLLSIKNRFKELRSSATGMSAGVLLVWGGLCFAKSVTSVQPVSWTAGIAVFVVGILAWKLCNLWTSLLFTTRDI